MEEKAMINHPLVERSKVFIIGLTGHAREGKDMAADALVAVGYFRLALADSLKQMIGSLDKGHLYAQEQGRSLWQFAGTEIGREIDPDIWLKNLYFQVALLHLKRDICRFVIPDVRFPNEAAVIREQWGGAVVRIVRPNAPRIPESGHASEALVDDVVCDAAVTNQFDPAACDFAAYRRTFSERVVLTADTLEREWQLRPTVYLPTPE